MLHHSTDRYLGARDLAARDPRGRALAATPWLVLGISLALAVASLALAQRSAAEPPPDKASCGSPGTPGQDEDVYARLQCRQEGLVLQLEHMVDKNLTSRAIGLELSENQKQLMKTEKAKARFLHGRSKSENFKLLSKGIQKNNRKSCELVPREGEVEINPNGVCEPDLGETCGAEEDLTLACDPKLKRPHPNKPGLVCAQSCETEASQTEAEEEMEVQQVAQDLEATYDAMEDNLIETNNTLDEVNLILESEALAARVASGDPCADIDPLPLGLEFSATTLRHAAGIVASVADVSAALTRQTIVAVAVAAGFGGGGGGNSSALGAILATAAGVAQEAYLIVDDIVSARRTELEDNTFACLQQAVLDIASVGGKVDASTALLGSKLDRNHGEIVETREALSEQISQLRAELLVLLSTPQGQRPNWPNP